MVTIIGSVSCEKEIMEIAKELTLAGREVHTPLFLHLSNEEITPEIKETLTTRIENLITDSEEVIVVSKNFYIGESTQHEISYASCKCDITFKNYNDNMTKDNSNDNYNLK